MTCSAVGRGGVVRGTGERRGAGGIRAPKEVAEGEVGRDERRGACMRCIAGDELAGRGIGDSMVI